MSTESQAVSNEPQSGVEQKGAAAATYVDERVHSNSWLSRNLNKVFPDHWSFMLGEIALYSFVVVLLSGVYLTLFYKPSVVEVIYDGPYIPLKGVQMSEAYDSALAISFEVRGGLLMRQIHHWSALFFVVAIAVHMFRIFFTGAFRKPRELNWVIGMTLALLALGAGFTGYSLPDDLLSGTGLRIIEGILLAIPVIGTWASFLLFGGEFPGVDIISRLYGIHILLIPGIIVAMITVHLMLVWSQKHTQFPGPGRTDKNVVGYPLMPVYMAKAGGFFFLIFGLITIIAGIVQINPIWIFGPYTPDQVSAGTQPDWYIGWLDGALRLMPNLEWVIFGYTLSLNVFIPTVILPGLIVTAAIIYPWLEAWATGDKREHHLLDRPRNAPTRTALGVMAITFYVVLWIGGGNDVIAVGFDLSINFMIWLLRFSLIILPALAFIITKRICLSLQRRDRDLLLHGRETGRILRLPHGEFIEVHAPINDNERARIEGKPDIKPLPEPPETDSAGVANPKYKSGKRRAGLSRFIHRDAIEKPTADEIHHADEHIAEQVEMEKPLLEREEAMHVAHDGAVLSKPPLETDVLESGDPADSSSNGSGSNSQQ
ncbi:MAG: cytochrome bc complex cytochrome b subunit [Actinomycetia bacterium]|nr:cytochrome bc complex cytochrome b subunit [Actinomycetes bacterium]MCH9800987.1 cytochrome bc complex cytochrome b subunit [Actinomycetes bacterium]